MSNPFDAMYEGQPPWEIGRPQQAFVRLADGGRIKGSVLDAGCGTGELSLELAARGHRVVGIDASGRAVEAARKKAAAARLPRPPRFEIADALRAWELGLAFDTVVDCGLLHTLTDGGRERYVKALQRVLVRGGTVHVLAFSDEEPDWGGPRRLSERELRRCFGSGWWIESVEAERFESTLPAELSDPSGAKAWLLTATYEGRAVDGVH